MQMPQWEGKRSCNWHQLAIVVSFSWVHLMSLLRRQYAQRVKLRCLARISHRLVQGRPTDTRGGAAGCQIVTAIIA